MPLTKRLFPTTKHTPKSSHATHQTAHNAILEGRDKGGKYNMMNATALQLKQWLHISGKLSPCMITIVNVCRTTNFDGNDGTVDAG